jgi:AcrR family transcriptional regulator
MTAASTRLKKRAADYHHGDLRNALLAVARRVLEKGDYERLSLRELARLAGVSANAPYRHFLSKDEILATVAAAGFDDLSARFDATRSPDAIDRLARMSDVYTGFACEQPAMYRVMFGGEKQVLMEYPVLNAAARACFGRLVAAVAAVQGGKGGEEDACTLARALSLWSLVHGWSRLAIDGVTAFLPPGSAVPASATTRQIIAGWD